MLCTVIPVCYLVICSITITISNFIWICEENNSNDYNIFTNVYIHCHGSHTNTQMSLACSSSLSDYYRYSETIFY